MQNARVFYLKEVEFRSQLSWTDSRFCLKLFGTVLNQKLCMIYWLISMC